jgi:hypothetical protein
MEKFGFPVFGCQLPKLSLFGSLLKLLFISFDISLIEPGASFTMLTKGKSINFAKFQTQK